MFSFPPRHEIESENEEAEDTIKDLGLIIKPTKSLRYVIDFKHFSSFS